MFFNLYSAPRCVFIRVRKTGTTSIVKGLMSNADGRIVAETIPADWQNAFCFAFVRNPFERLASAFEMFHAYKVTTEAEFQSRLSLSVSKILDVLEDDNIVPQNEGFTGKLKLHTIPMTHKAYNIGHAHFIGRFENFSHDYGVLARKLGLPEEVKHLRARNQPLEYRSRFTKEDRMRAERIFREDCDMFGYEY